MSNSLTKSNIWLVTKAGMAAAEILKAVGVVNLGRSFLMM
jgi:hypothetical protein